MHRLFILILCVVGWPTILVAADCPILTTTNNQYNERGEVDKDFYRCTPNLAEDFTGYQNRYAFIVGITRYQPFSSLDGPVYDAVAVANVLAERYGFTVRLVIDDEKLDVAAKVDKKLMNSISKQTLMEELGNFRQQVKNPSESLFVFYYSGHGLRKVDGDSGLGFLVPGNGDKKQPQTLLAFEELATEIADYHAHHTLLVLDACFSGTIFESASQVQSIFQNQLDYQPAKLTSGNNVSERALARPVVQAITAGGGQELVADQAKMYAEYMKIRRKEAESLSNHSPFTALLIQSLSGRIGIGNKQGKHIPMGTIPGSMLGYEIRQALMDNSLLRNINQTPRYDTLAGEGDVLLMPSREVLNPRLVGALYLSGVGYQSLRASGIRALLTEAEQITSKGSEPEKQEETEQKKQNLVREALPHFSYALDDKSVQVKEAALDALTQLLNNYDGPIEDFKPILSLLTKLLNTSKTDILLQKAAILLGSKKLSKLADEAAIKAMNQYIDQRLLPKWKKLLIDSELTDKDHPDKVSSREDLLNHFSDFSEQYPPTQFIEAEILLKAMESLESYRAAAQWLVSHGEQSILANYPIVSIKQFDSVITDLQYSIGKLEKSNKDTWYKLQQAQLDKLFGQLTEQLGYLFGTYNKYYERYPEYQRLYRRYRYVDIAVSDWLDMLPAWGHQFDYFNEEIQRRGAAIKNYFEQRRFGNLTAGELTGTDWQQEFQEAIEFFEQRTLHMCQIMLENKTDNEGLSNDLLKLFNEIMNNWFGISLKERGLYYQILQKTLAEELRRGSQLRAELMPKCQLWTKRGQLGLDWRKLYDNTVEGMKLVNQYLQLVQEISPLIERLKPEVEALGKDIGTRIQEDKEESKRQIQTAETEAEQLNQSVDNTKRLLKTVEEQSLSLSQKLSDIQTQQQEEKQLLDALRTSVEQIRDYFCRERGEDCSQSSSQSAQ